MNDAGISDSALLKELSARVAIIEAFQTILLSHVDGAELRARTLLKKLTELNHQREDSMTVETAQRWTFVAHMRLYMLDRLGNEPDELWRILERFDRKGGK